MNFAEEEIGHQCITDFASSGVDIELWWRREEATPDLLKRRLGSLSQEDHIQMRAMVPRAARILLNRRSLTRQVLGDLEGKEPHRLVFRRNTWGKPCLGGSISPEFSVSATHGLAAIAVCRNGRVGLDLEALDTAFDYNSVVQRYFSKEECAFLTGQSWAEKSEKFFQKWTQKESLVKLLGLGLSGLGVENFQEWKKTSVTRNIIILKDFISALSIESQ